MKKFKVGNETVTVREAISYKEQPGTTKNVRRFLELHCNGR
jgi:hypothetical protein